MGTSEKYPLPDKEKTALIKTLIMSDIVLIISGIILAMVRTGFESANWLFAITSGWLMQLKSAFSYWAYAPLVAAGLVIFLVLFNRIFWSRSKSYREEIVAVRQGLNGEILRLPIPVLAALFLLVGFAEEFVFRYGIIELTEFAFSFALSTPLEYIAAVTVSSGAFCLVHNQYDGYWSLSTVAVVGVILGVIYVQTSSLLAVWIIHSLYDFLAILVERRRMEKEPDYFHGFVPRRLLLDMVKNLEDGQE